MFLRRQGKTDRRTGGGYIGMPSDALLDLLYYLLWYSSKVGVGWNECVRTSGIPDQRATTFQSNKVTLSGRLPDSVTL